MLDCRLEALDRFFSGEDRGTFRLAEATERELADQEAVSLARFLAALDDDTITYEAPQRTIRRPLPAPIKPFDDTDPDFEWHQPSVITEYDRAVTARVTLEREFEALQAVAEPDKGQKARLAKLPDLIEVAWEHQAKALRASDEARASDEMLIAAEPTKRDKIDAWRRTAAGKASRRGVRCAANAGYQDLSKLSADEKAAHRNERLYVTNLRGRLKKRGMSEIEIDLEIEKRLAARNAA